MAKQWLEERWRELLPKLAQLTAAQEEEVARLCEAEIEAWKRRPDIQKLSSLRPVMTATRKAIREQLPVTPENRWRNARTGEYEHIALKYMNFSVEEWAELNALSQKNFEERLHNQQLIANPDVLVARAEKLLHSNRWDDLVVGLALATGRRLTELLKTGRFFPKSLYTVMFDGQLKRRDIALKPYEIPVLVSAELVLTAWRRLRSLEDCTTLENEAVAQKYSRAASEHTNRVFAGLIPQRSPEQALHTHTLRAIYARIAVLWFCPVQVVFSVYASLILGHYFIKDERQQRDALATEHYFDYVIGDGNGQVDGRQGVRLSEPGVDVLEAFRMKGEQEVSRNKKESGVAHALETKPHKSRGALTTKAGTFDQIKRLMEERNMRTHDEIVVDLLANDAVAHQLYTLLAPVAEELQADGPVAALQALIAAYRAGGTGAGPPAQGMAELLQEVSDEKDPVAYLRGLVERDKKFKEAISHRHAGTDYRSLSMAELERIKTTEAANERFRRAVDAILAHNEKQQDPLHLWFINAASVRDLVGGRNEAVQAYLATRKEEIDAHHQRFGLTPRHNRKVMKITDEITVE